MTETEIKVAAIIHKQIPLIADSEIVPKAEIVRDLGADSLDMMLMICDLEDAFEIEIPEEDAAKVVTCADAVEMVDRIKAAQ